MAGRDLTEDTATASTRRIKQEQRRSPTILFSRALDWDFKPSVLLQPSFKITTLSEIPSSMLELSARVAPTTTTSCSVVVSHRKTFPLLETIPFTRLLIIKDCRRWRWSTTQMPRT